MLGKIIPLKSTDHIECQLQSWENTVRKLVVALESIHCYFDALWLNSPVHPQTIPPSWKGNSQPLNMRHIFRHVYIFRNGSYCTFSTQALLLTVIFKDRNQGGSIAFLSEWSCHPLNSRVTSCLSVRLRPTSANEFGRYFSLKDSWGQTFCLTSVLQTTLRPGADVRRWPGGDAKKEVSEDTAGKIINKDITDQENWGGMKIRVTLNWTNRSCVKL